MRAEARVRVEARVRAGVGLANPTQNPNLRVGVRVEAVEGDDDRDAVVAHVADVGE